MIKVWNVKHRDGWCAVYGNRRPNETDDKVDTMCEQVVTLPLGIDKREPTCGVCKRRVRIVALRNEAREIENLPAFECHPRDEKRLTAIVRELQKLETVDNKS